MLHILKRVWHYIWAVAIASLAAAIVGFCYASFLIAPTYSSSVMLYVNNTSLSLGGADFTISSSQISAAQSLVDTYSVILKSRTTLELVKENSGVSYEYKDLYEMITAGPANETEIMQVTVVSEDPEEAALIANSIAEVLPVRIKDIINGATMEIVDSAVPNYQKIAPSVTKYTAIGFILGFLISVGTIAVLAIMDDTIHDEDYILQTYNYPILAKIPDLANKESKRYGYYYYQHSEQSKNETKS